MDLWFIWMIGSHRFLWCLIQKLKFECRTASNDAFSFFRYMCRILARLIDRHRDFRTKHTHFFSLLFIFDLRINNLMIMFNVYHIHFSLHFCVVLARCFICLCHGNICIPLKIVVWLVRFVSRLHRIYQCLIWDYCRFLSCSLQYHVGN